MGGRQVRAVPEALPSLLCLHFHLKSSFSSRILSQVPCCICSGLLRLLFTVAVAQVSLVSDDRDSCEKYGPGIL